MNRSNTLARRRQLAAILAGALAIPAFCQAIEPPATGSANVHQQKAAVAQSEQIMAKAQGRNGLLSQYLFMRDSYANSTDVAFRLIFNQYLSWYQTWVGDYAGARSSFSITQHAARDDAASPMQGSQWHAQPALEAIARMARDRKAVFFNENHSNALTRTLTVQMLAPLRELGFDTFAAETLYQSDMPALAKRGYAISATGFYTEEPVYADMVREALRLGYRVVAYEALSNAIGDAREAEQARNLVRDVYAEHPQARLVVNAGYAHIQEKGKYLGGASMAQHFARLSGIDPLTVEQTMMIPHELPSSDHPWYSEVISKLAPKQPIVFVNGKGESWSLKDAYDLSVFFPMEVLQRGRPTWLAMGDLRMPFQVSGRICDLDYPCLVEARHAGDPDQAIPADRYVIEFKGRIAGYGDILRSSTDPYPIAELWLRPGKYEILARDRSNVIHHRQSIVVGMNKPRP